MDGEEEQEWTEDREHQQDEQVASDFQEPADFETSRGVPRPFRPDKRTMAERRHMFGPIALDGRLPD